MARHSLYLISWVTLLLFQGCSTLEQAGQLMQGQKPTAQVKGVKVTALDFKGVELAFDTQVDNPNPFSIALDGLDYDLKLLNRSFLKGEQRMKMSLAANGRSEVKLPVRLEFKQLLEAYHQLKQADQVAYQLDMGLGFDIPVLGRVRLPVAYQGSLPIPKMPDIKVSSLDVRRLSMERAELVLAFEVANPNDFALMLEKLDYRLKLNGVAVGGGSLKQSMDVKQGGRGLVKLPVSLDLVQAGMGLYAALLGNSGLSYELNGSMDASSSLPILGDFQIPLKEEGRVELK